VQIRCISDQTFQPTSFQASSYTSMLLIACVSSQTGWPDMASHVSSPGLQLGGASNDTASPLTQGETPRFNSPAIVKYSLIQAGTSQIPQTAFSFKPALAGHPFIADKLRAALFVTSSASLQLLAWRSLLSIVTFRQSTFVYTLNACAYM
jgi:hypothetical protein